MTKAWRKSERRRLRSSIVVLAMGSAMGALGCGGSPTQPLEDVHVDLSDTLGDAVKAPLGPVPPDLASGAIDISNDSVTVRVRFAPGTFDAAVTTTFIYLDTDSSASTGVATGGGLGVDYWVNVEGTRGSLNRCQGNTCPSIATLPVSFVADGWDAIVARTLIGNDDGRMDLRVHSHLTFDTSSSDYMPNLALSPTRVR